MICDNLKRFRLQIKLKCFNSRYHRQTFYFCDRVIPFRSIKTSRKERNWSLFAQTVLLTQNSSQSYSHASVERINDLSICGAINTVSSVSSFFNFRNALSLLSFQTILSGSFLLRASYRVCALSA